MVAGGSNPRIVPVGLVPLGFLNAYLIQGERTIVVDAGYPFLAGGVLASLKRLHVQPADVSLILLTHGHLDHLGGIARLREHLDAPIAIDSADAEIARSGRDRPLHGTDLFGRVFARLAPRTVPAFEPDIVHDGELDLAPYGVAGQIVATPGHTPGSVSVVMEQDAICGDLLAGGTTRRDLAPALFRRRCRCRGRQRPDAAATVSWSLARWASRSAAGRGSRGLDHAA